MVSPGPSRFERPAVLLVSRIGDQLIALPAIRALCAMFPRGLQLLLGEGMLSFFYRGLPVGDTVRVRWDDVEAVTIDGDRMRSCVRSCDLFVCLTTQSAPFIDQLAGLMKPRYAVGFAGTLDDHLRIDDSQHMFDQLFLIPQRLKPSLRIEDFSAPPVLSRAAEDAASRLASERCGEHHRLLFVHPETGLPKRWSEEAFAWVLEQFLAERREYVAVVSSLEATSLDTLGGRVTRIGAHLELAIALASHADLFFGVDSCFLHAADLFRTPGLALFGPTTPEKWGFRFSPNGRHVAESSMDRVDREVVLQALLELAVIAESSPSGGLGDRDPRVPDRAAVHGR